MTEPRAKELRWTNLCVCVYVCERVCVKELCVCERVVCENSVCERIMCEIVCVTKLCMCVYVCANHLKRCKTSNMRLRFESSSAVSFLDCRGMGVPLVCFI